MKSVVKLTGEVIEFSPKTPEEIQETWLLCSEYVKAYETIKSKLKSMIPGIVNDKGITEPLNGYIFRVSNIQRKTYDKAVLRQVIKDEDTLDLLLTVDKTAVDNYLKENLETVGEGSTTLRQSMVSVGKPYQTIKLEKL